LAEFPERVEQVFVNKNGNPQGVYGVKLVIDGVQTEILVDDFLPSRYNQPFFSKTAGNEIWVSIAEKAWAKAFGGFTKTEGGFPFEAFGALLGCPGDQLFTKDISVDDCWEQLKEADEQNFLLAAYNANNKFDDGSDNGIVPGHAYSLISVHEEDEGLRLVKLRNPWGKGEWKGDYSDDSDKWTDELKEKVGFVKSQDGSFFMTVEDFHKYYTVYDIGHYHEGWDYTHQ